MLIGTDFEIKINESASVSFPTYKYCNKNDSNEKYIEIYTLGTTLLCSRVTIKPANMPDAPTMIVDTSSSSKCPKKIYLPRSVDEWVIKFYGCYYTYFESLPQLHDYLRNAGVVNLNEYFGASISHDLKLELRTGQYIYPTGNPDFKYTIPDVN
jgi:hypothetical protein